MGEQTQRGKLAGVRCNGASNHSDIEREINDFYATPEIATKPLIEYLKANYSDSQKESDSKCLELLCTRGLEIANSDITFKNMNDSGVKIRL